MQFFIKLFVEIFSLYLNIRLLPIRIALLCPLKFSLKVRICNIHKNSIIIHGNIKRHMICIGFGGSVGVAENSNTFIYINQDAKIIFNGNTNISQGTSLRVDSGVISFGSNFYCNKNCFFRSTLGIIFGSDVLLGWNIVINDSDGHKIYVNGIEDNSNNEKINIGNHVWIASYVNIGKNALIADGCIVAQKSLVVKKHCSPNCLIGGIPSRIIKTDVSWKF